MLRNNVIFIKINNKNYDIFSIFLFIYQNILFLINVLFF